MTPPFSLTTRSEEATRRVGQALGHALSPGLTVLLDGDLGAGKTVLVRGAGDALGVGGRVRSPSFTLVNEYPLPSFEPSNPLRALIHADLYRLGPDEVEALGLDEYAGAPDAALLAEWPDRWARPPEDALRVELRALDEESRLLTFRPYGDAATEAARSILSAVERGDCPGADLASDQEARPAP